MCTYYDDCAITSVFFLFCKSENLERQSYNKVYIFLLHFFELLSVYFFVFFLGCFRFASVRRRLTLAFDHNLALRYRSMRWGIISSVADQSGSCLIKFMWPDDIIPTFKFPTPSVQRCRKMAAARMRSKCLKGIYMKIWSCGNDTCGILFSCVSVSACTCSCYRASVYECVSLTLLALPSPHVKKSLHLYIREQCWRLTSPLIPFKPNKTYL